MLPTELFKNEDTSTFFEKGYPVPDTLNQFLVAEGDCN